MSDLKKMYTAVQEDPFPQTLSLRLGEQELTFSKRTWTLEGEQKGLRYGENPDQPAALFELTGGSLELDGIAFRAPGQGLVAAVTEQHMLQAGKHPGKINLTDVDSGISILQYLTAKPAVIILKHNNPCGAAWSDSNVADALDKALYADRIAAFGGTVVTNTMLDEAAAAQINASYFEVIAAPEYSQAALEILKERKNLRILCIPGLADLGSLTRTPFLDIKSLSDGGLIVQFSFQNRIRQVSDFLPAQAQKDGTILMPRKPTDREAEDLLFAWAVEAGVSSNSVIFARDGATVAIGTGEQDRVGCVELAIHKAYTKYADLLCFQEQHCSLYELKEQARTDTAAASTLNDIQSRTQQAKGGLPGSVLVSDGFFPFRDGVDVAIEQEITAIAQPGGSLRDDEVITALNQASPQVAMVFTGQRAFQH